MLFVLLGISIAVLGLQTAHAQGAPQFENLVPVDDAEVAVAYIDPNADFSVFKRAMILDTCVAFWTHTTPGNSKILTLLWKGLRPDGSMAAADN